MATPRYVWESPRGSMVIRISLDVVSRLRMAAMEALKSVPRRGLEIGGLLLGSRETRDAREAISIDDFVPVESEHRSGPSYQLSENDRRAFRDAVATHAGAVGIFRTQTRSEALPLEADDVGLFERYFQTESGVFLLIHPASARAALFVREAGTLTLANEFPFHPADLQTAGAKKEDAGMEPAAIPPVAAERSSADFRWQRWIMPVSAALLGMTVAAAALHFRERPVRPPVTQPAEYLSLNVARRGRGLELQWDPSAPAVRGTSHAMLSILDGSHKSQMDLSRRDLVTGKLSYWPDSQDVTFRMTLSGAGRNTMASIRFLGGETEQPGPEAAKAESKEVPAARPPVERRQQAADNRTSARARAQGTASRSEEDEPRPSPFVAPMAKAPAAAVSSDVRETNPHLASAERVDRGGPTWSKPDVPVVREHPPAKAQPGVSVTVEPVTTSRWSRFVGRIPLIRRLKKEPQPFDPPRATREFRPVLSPREKSALIAPVPVDVKVYVAESGKVDYAELVSGIENRDLAATAVYAARRWTFTPARLGEAAVPSEVILHFRFEP